jgi:hypothetical protein
MATSIMSDRETGNLSNKIDIKQVLNVDTYLIIAINTKLRKAPAFRGFLNSQNAN